MDQPLYFSDLEEVLGKETLAPLLFILIMEDLIRMISRDKINDTLKNFHFGKFVYITYLLIVDNIFLFSNGSRRKIIKLKSIIELF